MTHVREYFEKKLQVVGRVEERILLRRFFGLGGKTPRRGNFLFFSLLRGQDGGRKLGETDIQVSAFGSLGDRKIFFFLGWL